MEQLQFLDVGALKEEIKLLRQSLDYWNGELKFKKDAELAEIEKQSAQSEYHKMWKSRSSYIEIICYILIKFKNLTTKSDAYSILKDFFTSDYKVNYQKIDEVFNYDRPTKT